PAAEWPRTCPILRRLPQTLPQDFRREDRTPAASTCSRAWTFESLQANRRRTSRVVLRVANRTVAVDRRPGQRVPERWVLPGEIVRGGRRSHGSLSGRRVLLQLVRLQRNRLQQGL